MRNIILFLALLILGAACRQQTPPPPTTTAASEAYTPGLGEIMTLQQMRHTKLWLAGEASNWDLATYELKELGEGFDDVVKFHPTHEESPVAPKDAIPRMITMPLSDLRTADSLTKACNDCHQATNFGFNRLQRPIANPYPNQVFAPPKE